MTEKLSEKVCLITGSTGIAAATIELAIQEGAQVFFTGLLPDSCQELAETIRAGGGECEAMAGDLTSSAVVQQAVGRCLARFGRIDALFNVAGISGRRLGDGPIHECTEDGWDATLNANLRTAFLVCRAVISQMLQQPTGPDGLRGSVLNMSSVLAFAPEPRYFATHAYAASKGAIIGLTKAMAAYYAPHKIRVNAIAPGLARTPMSARAQADPAVMDFIKSKQPLIEGMIEPEEIAHAAIFLLSPDSRAITGDIITIDAGWSIT